METDRIPLLNLLIYVWWKDTACYAPIFDIYNRLKHANFGKESYSIPQIYLTKQNSFCNNSVNIPEDITLQVSIWMIWGNSSF